MYIIITSSSEGYLPCMNGDAKLIEFNTKKEAIEFIKRNDSTGEWQVLKVQA